MAAGGKGIVFKVTDTQSGRKSQFEFEQYSTFEERCKEKFEYAPDSDVVFVLEENDDAELGEPVFECLETMTKLKMKPKHGLTSTHTSGQKSEDDDKEPKQTDPKQTSDQDKEQVVKTVNENTETSSWSDPKNISASVRYDHRLPVFEDTRTDPLLRSSSCQHSDKKSSDEQKPQNKERTSWTWSDPEIEQFTSGADYIKEQLKKRGKDELKFIIEEADKMEVQPLAIGVIGTSGQGKSTLINTLRDLLDSDEDGAPVGETETTTKCRAYRHPVYPKLVFWDIPGVGTNNFKRETYLSDIKFEKYDFYLICSCSRSTEDDRWLIEEIKKGEKECYFLRTKVDQDIDNAKRRNKNISETLDEIRKSCHVDLGQERKVFLLDCREKYQYDFPEFLKTLCADAPQEQKRSLTLGLVSVEMIEKKAMYLKSEIWKTMSLSAFGNVVIPEFSFGIDSALIYRKLEEYQKQFELTDAHIRKYAKLIGLPETEFRRTAELKINFDFIRKQGINYLIKFVAGGVITEDNDPFVSLVGIGIVVGMAFRTTGKILEKILDDCRHDAIAIFKLVNARQTNN